MESITPESLAIYKFQQDNILMIHKLTRVVYQYFQTPIIAHKQRNLIHEHILPGYLLPSGIIYKKGVTSMNAEISKRMKASNKQFYEEEELVNTFLPVLLSLQYLHQKNIIHGSICPQNIIFNDEGDVLLRDGLLQIPNNKYYEVQKLRERTQNDDISALGQILLEASSLVSPNIENRSSLNHQSVMKKIISRYSRGYILGINIMLKKIQKFYPHMQKILKSNESYIDSSDQLVSMYRKLKGEKQFRPAITPILNHSNFKYLDLICKTPLIVKKVPKVQDAENKKTYQDVKKKNIERVSKITQKMLNNQTLKKPDMALKKMSNMKFTNWQENQKSVKKVLKQDVLKFASPLKRLKTISRRKAF